VARPGRRFQRQDREARHVQRVHALDADRPATVLAAAEAQTWGLLTVRSEIAPSVLGRLVEMA
jgi:hypothetical protein